MTRFWVWLLCLGAVLTTLAGVAYAADDEFTVTDIRVEGLQRVSAGTVFSAFPVSVGEDVDGSRLAEATRTLFRTGFFTDIRLGREDSILVISVVERPSISKIEIEGNKAINTEDLLKGLRSAGLAEGQVFQRVTLERLELEIMRTYVAQGRYSASVKAQVEDLPRNRVALKIKINEGSVASISHINFVGNEAFSDEDLKDLMELKTPGLFSFFTADDKYAREKLSGDLERIRSHYLDRGYIKFNMESTPVSISPNREEVFITVNLVEGPQYKIRDVKLRGDFVIPEEEIQKLILVKPEQTFSRQMLTFTSEVISRRLGAEGYTFANVNAIPEPHDDNTATITFYVEPGVRTYVRRINFRGNVSTSDEVLRQELRQMEGAAASTDAIEASKTRLERLGFFREVTVETPAVPGVNDQIDVVYNVEEQPTGSLSASLGFSQTSGLIVGASVSENNFFGTGRQVAFGVNRSQSVKSANVSYLNPYYTVDGVSRGFNMFYRETNYAREEVIAYVADEFGGGVNFGYPIDNFSRLNFGLGYTNTTIKTGVNPAQEVEEFIQQYGSQFDVFALTGSWARSTFNRGVFPTRGLSQSLSLDVALPNISDTEFFKVRYGVNFYHPLDRDDTWLLRFRSDLAYGSGYSETDRLPFFQHYYAGGIGSVRGYEANSLGPRGTAQALSSRSDRPLGGNFLALGGAELIFPLPIVKDQRAMRTSLFLDAGQVFDTSRESNLSVGDIRLASGVSFTWITAIGPLSFSLAKALNPQAGDDREFFQFSLGQTF
jgi:outer membrane protein insertion porin family